MVIHSFYDTGNKSNKKYATHKETYLRYALKTLVMEVNITPMELLKTLDKQYINDEENQYPIIDGRTYWIYVST